jgi:hypothetical protein
MAVMTCGQCADGWVCELHPDEPWFHHVEMAAVCGGRDAMPESHLPVVVGERDGSPDRTGSRWRDAGRSLATLKSGISPRPLGVHVSRSSRTRLNLSSGSVHPGIFTLTHERVTPPRYGLSRSFAT